MKGIYRADGWVDCSGLWKHNGREARDEKKDWNVLLKYLYVSWLFRYKFHIYKRENFIPFE